MSKPKRPHLLGIDDGPFDKRRDTTVPIVGVLMEAHDLVEAVAVTRFEIDGADAAGFLADWIVGLRFANTLHGVVEISGSKNAALPILAATILATGKCVIKNVPMLKDVETLGEILRELGVGFERRSDDGAVETEVVDESQSVARYELVSTMRASFNVLGPLTNPAGAPNQVIGVFTGELIEPLARVLATLGSRHVLVVHAEDGLDEISVGADTSVAEARDGEVRTFTIGPEQFGMQKSDVAGITVSSPEATCMSSAAATAAWASSARKLPWALSRRSNSNSRRRRNSLSREPPLGVMILSQMGPTSVVFGKPTKGKSSRASQLLWR